MRALDGRIADPGVSDYHLTYNPDCQRELLEISKTIQQFDILKGAKLF